MVAPKCLNFVRLVALAACTPLALFGSECGDMCRTMVSTYLSNIDTLDSDLRAISFDGVRDWISTINNSFLDIADFRQQAEDLAYDALGDSFWGSSLEEALTLLSYPAADGQLFLSSLEEEIDSLESQVDYLVSTEVPAIKQLVGSYDCSACDSTPSDNPDDPGGGGDNPSGGQCSCTCSDELADIAAKIAAVKTSVDNIRAELQEHKQKLEDIKQKLYEINNVIDQIKDHQKRIDDYLYDDLTEKLKELKELLEEMRDNVKEYYDDFKKVQMMALTNSVNEVRKLNEKKFNTLINMISNNIPFLRDFVTMVSNNLAGIQQGFYTNELLLTATTGQLERIASLIPSNINSRDYFINQNYSNAVFYLDNDGQAVSMADLDEVLNGSSTFDWGEFSKLSWFTRAEYLLLKLAGVYSGTNATVDITGQMDGKETLEQKEDDLKDSADSLSQAFEDCVGAGTEFIQSFQSFTQRGEAVNKLHLLSNFIGDEPLEVDVDGELVGTCHALLALWWTVFFSYVLVVFCWRMFRFWFYFSLYMYRWIMGVVL